MNIVRDPSKTSSGIQSEHHDGCPDDPTQLHGWPGFRQSNLSRGPSGVSIDRSIPVAPKLHHQNSLFMDPAEIKAKVRQSLAKPVYNVQDNYWSKGYCQLIARSAWFERVTLAVIAINAGWIAVDTDFNKKQLLTEADFIFQLAEHLFCSFFVFELTTRFAAFRSKWRAFHDPWFSFDTVLVTTMVLETWVLTIVLAFIKDENTDGPSAGGLNTSVLRVARVLRLSRMARMARLLRAMPELMILIKGLVAAIRSVFFALCLLMGIVFVFAIAFTQLTSDFVFHKIYFDHVLLSMYTLLFRGAFLDNVSFLINDIGDDSLPLAGLFIAFVLIAALTVMNMLIGVLVEVVSSVARMENEEAMLAFVRNKMEPLVRDLDTDGNGEISREEFIHLVENPAASQTLSDVGVDPVGLVDYADFIFSDDVTGEDQGELSFTDFMEVVLELRGSNSATVKDIVDLRKFISSVFKHFEVKLDHLIARRLRNSLENTFSRNSSVTAGSFSMPTRTSSADSPGSPSQHAASKHSGAQGTPLPFSRASSLESQQTFPQQFFPGQTKNVAAQDAQSLAFSHASSVESHCSPSHVAGNGYSDPGATKHSDDGKSVSASGCVLEGRANGDLSTAASTDKSSKREKSESSLAGSGPTSLSPLRPDDGCRSLLGESMKGLVEDLEISLEWHVQNLDDIVKSAREQDCCPDALPAPRVTSSPRKVVPAKLAHGASRGLQSKRAGVFSPDLKRIQLEEHVLMCSNLVSLLQERLSNLGDVLQRPQAVSSLTDGVSPALNECLPKSTDAEDIHM